MSFEDRAATAPTLAEAFPVRRRHAPASTVATTSTTTTTRPPALRGAVDVVLPMRHAGARRLRLAWELLGPEDAPVVLVSGGISADRHLAASATFRERGWAEATVGRDRALDPSRLRLLAFDHVGADGGLDAVIDTGDQADAAAMLLDVLGIPRLHAFVGYSYGAAVGLQFAARHRARLERVVAVSGAHRAHPWAAAWRVLQRKAAALGGLQCAEGQGPALALSESLELHRVSPGDVRAPATVVAVEGDPLVPLSDAVALVEGLGGPASLRILRSPHAHDAFLKDDGRIDAILRRALSAEAPA